MTGIRHKWRPPMVLVVILVCSALLAVPTISLLTLRISTNRFVRETEQSLIQQSAIYSAIYATAFEKQKGPLPGQPLPPAKQEFWNGQIHPIYAKLNVRQAQTLQPRPDGVPYTSAIDPRYRNLAPELSALAERAKRTTLSGVVFLDHNGVDILAAKQVSFANLPEVTSALNGDAGSVLRWRGEATGKHTYTSVSRNTVFRVFVTLPVIVEGHVIGVVYLSRTPNNLGKYLFEERFALLLLLGITALGATILGGMLLRLQLRPIRALRDQARRVTSGRQTDLEPLRHYGMREIAELGSSLLTMARSLSDRSKEISTYTSHVTHELKSPVTGIIGAAELLEDDSLGSETRQILVRNIAAEGQRMDRLLAQLREMTKSRQMTRGGPSTLADMQIEAGTLEITKAPADAIIPLSREHGEIILGHMAQNAIAHGAQALEISWDGQVLRVRDDGTGLSKADLDRVTDPFFTTRRETGGTGMGLAICAAILEHYNAQLHPRLSETGAVFEISFASAPT